MALGASPLRIQGMVLSGAAGLCVAGLAIGTVLAFLGAREIAAFLFRMRPSDPWTFLGSGLLLLLSAWAWRGFRLGGPVPWTPPDRCGVRAKDPLAPPLIRYLKCWYRLG